MKRLVLHAPHGALVARPSRSRPPASGAGLGLPRDATRGLLAFLVALSASSPARAQLAQPWLLTGADAVLDGDVVVSAAPLVAGDAWVVAFETGGTPPNARVQLLHHTLVDGPLLAAPAHAYTASTLPLVVWDGENVIASGSGSVVQVSNDAGLVFGPVSASIFDVTGIALDAAGLGVALASISNGGIGTNGARSQTAGASFVDDDIGNSSLDVPESVAVRNGRALAIANFGVLGASDVAIGNWTNLGQPPLGIAADSPLVALANGGFAAVGAAGAGFYVEDLAAGPVLDCGPGGDDLIALATDGVALWIAKAGIVVRVDDPSSCPWVPAESLDTGLDVIGALAAAGPREVIAVGVLAGAPSMAWRNRPPSVVTPVLTTVSLDEGESLVQTFGVEDPDVAFGDTLAFLWTCDVPGLVTDGSSASGRLTGVDGQACPGDADVVSTCSVTATDSDGQVATNAFVVTTSAVDDLPPQAAAVGAITVTPGVLVDEGTSLTAAATFSEACPDVIEWTLVDAQGADVVIGPIPQPFAAPVAFVAPDVPGGASVTFTLRAHAVDLGGNTLDREVDIIVVGVAPPAATLVCDGPSILAGETAHATAAPANGSGPIADFVWTAALEGVARAFVESAAGDAIDVATDRCDHGSALGISVVPSAPTGDGPAQQCTIALDRPATPPAFTPPAIVEVPLGPAGARVSLPTDADDCPQESVLVSWDLARLAALIDVDAVLEGAAGAPLELAVAVGDVAALLGATGAGTSVVVTGTATDDAGATAGPVDVELRFSPAANLGDLAGITLALGIDDTRALEPGAIVEVTGTLTSDLAVALPSLRVSLVEHGLRIVPDTARMTSDCPQVRGALDDVPLGTSALVVDGVTEACPASVSFLARRGLADGGLVVGACAWGPDAAPVTRCGGGLAVASPSALSCASTSSPAAWCGALFAFAARSLRRRRR